MRLSKHIFEQKKTGSVNSRFGKPHAASGFKVESYSNESLTEFFLNQSPRVVEEVKEALLPKFSALAKLSESDTGDSELREVFEIVNSFREKGVSEVYLRQGVEQALVEGWGSAALGAAAGTFLGGPVGGLLGAGIGAVLWPALKRLGGGAIKTLTQKISGFVLRAVGVDTESGFGLFLTNAIAEAGPTGIVKILSGDCPFLVNTLLRAVPPFLAQSAGFGTGLLGNVVNHALADTFNDTDFVKTITDKLSGTVCGTLSAAGKKIADSNK